MIPARGFALAALLVATALPTGCSDADAVPMPPAGSVRDTEMAAAIDAAAGAVRKAPQDAAAWTQLGMVLDANGFFGEAASAYRRATDLRPGEPKVWYHLAVVLEREDRFDEAVEAAGTAARLAPDYPPLPRSVALWHLARGRLDDAETNARRAAELSRGSSGALLVLGRVLLEQGRDDEAREVLDAAVMSWPPAWGDAGYARFLAATAARRADAASAEPASQPRPGDIADLRGAVEPPILPDPWRAELVPLRAGAVARRRAARPPK